MGKKFVAQYWTTQILKVENRPTAKSVIGVEYLQNQKSKNMANGQMSKKRASIIPSAWPMQSAAQASSKYKLLVF